MTNLKKVFLVILVGALLLSVSSIVTGTDDFQVINDAGINGITGGVQDIPTNNVTGDTNVTTITNNVQNPANNLGTVVTPNTTNNTANNTSTYNNTGNLPKTGVGDYTVLTAIVLLAIIAIYAYKKVKDYKGI